MVERHRAFQHLMDGMPLRGRRVGTGGQCRQGLAVGGQQGQMGDGDHPHPGIAVRVAVGGQLLNVHRQPAQVQARFLCQFTEGCLLCRLPDANEPAGQGEAAHKRVDTAADQSRVQHSPCHCENHQVHA